MLSSLTEFLLSQGARALLNLCYLTNFASQIPVRFTQHHTENGTHSPNKFRTCQSHESQAYLFIAQSMIKMKTGSNTHWIPNAIMNRDKMLGKRSNRNCTNAAMATITAKKNMQLNGPITMRASSSRVRSSVFW